MQVCERELRWLNFYRASELEGGLVLAQLARCVRDPKLMLRLTRHGAEEVKHAELWTETMLAVGGVPSPTADTYQRRYATRLGPPQNTLQVLALTQVFERRVYKHFLVHARRPETHPAVRRTLLRMVEEERDHLSWVKRWLDKASDRRPDVFRRLMASYSCADRAIYAEVTAEYGFDLAA